MEDIIAEVDNGGIEQQPNYRYCNEGGQLPANLVFVLKCPDSIDEVVT